VACTSALLFWLVRGHLTELGRIAAAGLADAGSALTRACWHYLAGWALLPRGRFTEAGEHFASAVRSASDAGAGTEAAWARVGAAYAAVYDGDLDRARTLVAEVDGDVDIHLRLSHLIADAHVRIAANDVTGASALLSDALPQAERTGSPWTLGVLLGVLGRVRGVQGEPDEAHALLTRSVRIFGTLGDTWGMAHQLTHLADAAALRDEPQRAALLYGAVDGLADEVGAGVFPVWRDLSDRCQARAVESLGLDVLTSLRRRGRDLRGDQILRLASGDPISDVVGETLGAANA
jgi:non-specific serine/threonine protein kinase